MVSDQGLGTGRKDVLGSLTKHACVHIQQIFISRGKTKKEEKILKVNQKDNKV